MKQKSKAEHNKFDPGDGGMGKGLSAISLDLGTRRLANHAVHKGNIQGEALALIREQAKSERLHREVIMAANGSRLVANLRQPQWGAFLVAVHQLEAKREKDLGQDVMGLIQTPEGDLIVMVMGDTKAMAPVPNRFTIRLLPKMQTGK